MNIQDAGRRAKSGCFIRRGIWEKGKHAGVDDYGFYVKLSPFHPAAMHFPLSVEDIVAEDWEEFIPPNKLKSGLLRLKLEQTTTTIPVTSTTSQ